MTSEERHEARYQRRKAKRLENKRKRAESIPSLDELFTYHSLRQVSKVCCNGVRWKNTVQQFELHLFTNIPKIRKNVLSGNFKPSATQKFKIYERGKERKIEAPSIMDRPIHKILTNEVLLPLYKPYMIYNNGASQKGKGYKFAMDMLRQDLHKFYKRYGTNGNVIVFDLHHFFPTANHNELLKRHREIIQREDLIDIIDKAEKLEYNGKGLPLGLELSQAEMIALPSKLDNYIKCQLSLKYLGHYMDDYYILVPPERDVKDILNKVIKKAKECGFIINEGKTLIQPITKKFKYCKTYFTLTDTGKVVRTKTTDGIKIMRKRLNMFKRKYKYGGISMEDVYQSIQSSLSVYKKDSNYHNYIRLKRMIYTIFHIRTDKRQEYLQKEMLYRNLYKREVI